MVDLDSELSDCTLDFRVTQ
ncbi:hypothetical protein [Bradyrhizobium diazoefficiens]